MTKQEIIQRIAGYCNAGLLNGVKVHTVYFSTHYLAENIHVDGNAVRFDQSWGMSEGDYRNTARDCNFYDHITEYVLGVLLEIEKNISIDRNLF